MEPKTTKIGKYSVTYFNDWELKTLKDEIFKKEIYRIEVGSQSPTIFDIGAHIGLATMYFKDKYPLSKIYCFEPNPNIFPLLEENMLINGLDSISMFNIAIGKKKCVRDLYIDNSGEGIFSTSSFRKDAWNGKQKSIPIPVNMECISEYIDEDIDILKIDVEGLELDILKDIDENDMFKKIRNIFIEYHPKKNQSISRLTSILERNNYTLSFKEEGKVIQEPKEDLILIVAKKRIN